MTIGKLCRRALVPVLGGMLLLAPSAIPAPGEGVGRVVVMPARVTAGSTNTFTLVFSADTGPLQGQTLLDVPRAWSAPQMTRPGQPGYVALAPGSCSSATRLTRIVGLRLIIATSCRRGQSFTVTYGPATAPQFSADGFVFLTQTRPATGETAMKVVTTKRVTRDRKGRKHTQLVRRRVRVVLKPTFRPLAQKKQPVVVVTGAQFDHLTLNVPTIATAGTPFTITVRAEDAYGNTAIGYGNLVSFSSSDPDAFLPQPYRLQSTDLGAKSFGGVILRRAGAQTITVTDDAGRSDVSTPITVYVGG